MAESQGGGSTVGGGAAATRNPPEPVDLTPRIVRTSLYAGLFGALGASFGWFLWIAIPQVAHHPGPVLGAIAVGWTVGLVFEGVQAYLETSRTQHEGRRPETAKRLRALWFLAVPLVSVIVQLAAENTISELVRAVIVPFAHSLAVFFLLGAAIGLVFHGLLSFSRPEKSGGDAQPLAVRLTLMPIFVIFWVMFVLVLVILLVTWPLSAMKLTPAPVDSVSDCVWVILVVSVVFTMGTMIVRHTLAEVVCLWLATTCVTLLTATLPFYGSVHQTADKSARAGGAAVFTPIAQGLLRSPSVPASTWLEAQAILARNGDLASRSDASKDFLNRRLYSLLGCPHLPTEPGKPPLGVSKTRWRKDFEADLRLKQQACTLLTSRANPGLMNSIYVVSLFTLGVFIGSLAERRSLPKHYFHHPVHVIDRIAFCGLGVGAVVALILW